MPILLPVRQNKGNDTMKDINPIIAQHVEKTKEIFFSENMEPTEKAQAIENIRFSLTQAVKRSSVTPREINELFDKMLILLGKKGVLDVVINGARIVAKLSDKDLTDSEENTLAEILASEQFEISKVATKKSQFRDPHTIVVQYPKQGEATKKYSYEQWAKAYGY